MLEKCYEYFENNFEELLKKYDGRYVVIKDEKIIADYDSFDKAYTETCKTEELGTFIIQHCIVETPETAVRFAWNNVTFEHTVK